MNRSGRRDWRGIGCAAILAASIAFPAGLILGGGEPVGGNGREGSRPAPPRGQALSARNVYSPNVAGDPYVIEQQRRVLRALEVSCLQSKQYCAEAEQARRRIEEAEAGR